ncbi:MAG TPA: ABC-F family ATP-binding cassette domain-containing protein [Acidimicrobiales bacterium]|nr:ABC-F family ATP-binding cassette domain-containing protein [Acidimicrobiales bacterium]
MPLPSHSSLAATLTARGVGLTRGRAVILDAIDLVVAPGDCIGVVGPNGVGKSTLLRVLAGIDQPDTGAVSLQPPNANVGYLAQEPERRPSETVRAFLGRRTGVDAATATMEEAASKLVDASDDADAAYSDALERWTALGGPDLDARAEATTSEVGLPLRLLDAEMTTLSGGEAARASLAATLLSRYDLFLLDEPTNDLDFAGLDLLERFVTSLGSGVVIVSHDRAFLERTITSVIEIDEHSHQGSLFNGGWLAYLELKATARRHAEQDYEAYASQRDALVQRGQRQKEWSTAGVRKATKNPKDGDKFVRNKAIAGAEKLASKVRISEKAIERLDRDKVDKPWEGWDLRLEIAQAPRSGDVVVRMRQAVVEQGSFRLGPVDLEVAWADRVAILGPNGSGKTTLIQAILGRIPLTSGERFLGPGVVVGELDQARRQLAGERPVLDLFAAASGLLPREARTLLAKFGIAADHVVRPWATLSPGERTRTMLALLQAKAVNCLVLDEPTNHLDLPAIEQLEQALDRFEGTVLLVTHDRRLLDAVHLDREIRLG